MTIPENILGLPVAGIGDNAFVGKKLVSFTASGIYEVKRNVFFGCITLTTVILSDQIMYIGSRAFAEMDNLDLVVIFSKQTVFADYAFSGSTPVILYPHDSYAKQYAQEHGLRCVEIVPK